MKKSVNKVKRNTSSILYINILGRSIHVFHLVLIGFVLFAVGYIAKGSIESVYVAQNGVFTKGVITDIRQSGSKGVEDYYYKFNYNGIEYSNLTLHLSKNVGDTVEVVFIKCNPTKNRLKESLVSTYGFFLKRNQNLKQE
ncbi:MAG: hypothetical protein GX273_00620 [Bacteroidales bacterium]|nr:hypothetical protein [Bacteroidales bacterium]